jgi:hypothetical protein
MEIRAGQDTVVGLLWQMSLIIHRHIIFWNCSSHYLIHIDFNLIFLCFYECYRLCYRIALVSLHVCHKQAGLWCRVELKSYRYSVGLPAIQIAVLQVFLSLYRPVMGFTFKYSDSIGLKIVIISLNFSDSKRLKYSQ